QVPLSEPPVSGEFPSATIVAVVRAGQRRFALIVDRVIASEEIVVKPLHGRLRRLEMYSGATILGDGHVALILNPEGIASVMKTLFTTDAETTKDDQTAPLEAALDLLLVRTLNAHRIAVPLASVRRIVMLDCRDLQRVDSCWFAPVEGTPTPVHSLDDAETLSPSAGQAFALFPRRGSRVGAVVAEVLGTRSVPGTSIQSHAGTRSPRDFVMLHEGMTPIWRFGPACSESGIPRSPSRILVVDDTQFFRDMVGKCMRDEGYEVSTAAQGAEALDLLRREKFDLVVSDVEMPVMDGLEFAAAVRGDEALRSIPLVALTTLTGTEIQERARRHGFDAFEVKLDAVSLRATVRALLARTFEPDHGNEVRDA
ncbi:MAG TPA: response regulator, partial [Pirellulaceae bacterium]